MRPYLLLLGVLTLLSCSSSSTPPPLSWQPISSNSIRVMFPIRDYYLEIKSLRPEVYNTNPSYLDALTLDPTLLILELHNATWGTRVGRFVWNTIKYDSGRDVLVEECNGRQYKAYSSFPAGGQRDQVWRWEFGESGVVLRCGGEEQFRQEWRAGDQGLEERCEALGAAPVDRISLKFMAGLHYRAVPRLGELVRAEQEELPACSCWHPRCNYCSSLSCTTTTPSFAPLFVTSSMKWRRFTTLILYSHSGTQLGKFHLSRSRIILTGGCITCYSPHVIRRLRGTTTWGFSLQDGVVRVEVEGEVLYERQLKGECRKVYNEVARVAFMGTRCEDSFLVEGEMEVGENMTHDCGGQCQG